MGSWLAFVLPPPQHSPEHAATVLCQCYACLLCVHTVGVGHWVHIPSPPPPPTSFWPSLVLGTSHDSNLCYVLPCLVRQGHATCGVWTCSQAWRKTLPTLPRTFAAPCTLAGIHACEKKKRHGLHDNMLHAARDRAWTVVVCSQPSSQVSGVWRDCIQSVERQTDIVRHADRQWTVTDSGMAGK